MSTVRAASPVGAGRVAGSVATAREAELLVENARLRVQVEALDERLRLREDHRRALLHILQDQHQSNLKLENARKAMIHIMDDLRKTTEEITRREQELRDKQEQLVQAGKLATLGELTTGVAHELNNPLNNIGLFLGNVIDLVELGREDKGHVLADLNAAAQQVHKASEIISHLRTFGRLAPVGYEDVAVNEVVLRALSLISEQLRLREISVELDLSPANPVVTGSPIQLEQVFMNILANARDALQDAPLKVLRIRSGIKDDRLEMAISDSGPGIPPGLERRIFDPFFTTKDVGHGTGLGLSIAYGIIKDHQGTIEAISPPGGGATFVIQIPLARS